MTKACKHSRLALAALAVAFSHTHIGHAQPAPADLKASYGFLVGAREQGGALYAATASELRGRRLPLSFVDSAAYWGEHVCQGSAAVCGITDFYDVQSYTLRPDKNVAGDLQTERVNIHNGVNIYDGATWQIAVMVGRVRNGFAIPGGEDAYALVSNQNRLLQLGYSGDAKPAVPHQYRALTHANTFRYNGTIVEDPARAFVFRTLPRAWLSVDPLLDSLYDDWIKATGLPLTNSAYQRGKISWTDWKPISGENAWAFLIGPLQAAYLHYHVEQKKPFVPFRELAIQNALAILPTFAAMQSELGALYYAPQGTVANQGDDLVNPYEVAVENNFSLYAGLNILRQTLLATRANDKQLSPADQIKIRDALTLIDAMIKGGKLGANRSTQGLLSFFKNFAWRDGEFMQGGFANSPAVSASWRPRLHPKAVDVNTWGIAALGAAQIDEWFGFGAAFNNWQKTKGWGGYGVGKNLWGVGFSDLDGNGIDAAGNYRQGIMSAEWTAGAIAAVRNMLAYYGSFPKTAADYAVARGYVDSLRSDEQSMLAALGNLRGDRYASAGFPDTPKDFNKLITPAQGVYLYASKRYMIPFGWYANPLPSTCSTAWVVMLDNRFDPFNYGGKPAFTKTPQYPR
ncbi:MAG: hypothetical protein ABW049_01925 [Spongiibacteraceae bacterium]